MVQTVHLHHCNIVPLEYTFEVACFRQRLQTLHSPGIVLSVLYVVHGLKESQGIVERIRLKIKHWLQFVHLVSGQTGEIVNQVVESPQRFVAPLTDTQQV